MASKKTPNTLADRVARHAERRRAAGLVHFRMWVPPEIVEDLKAAADKLASESIRKKLDEVSP